MIKGKPHIKAIGENAFDDICDQTCRLCQEQLHLVVDLGSQPLANTLTENQNEQSEHFPLALWMCNSCKTGQLSHAISKFSLFTSYTFETPSSSELKEHYAWLLSYFREKEIISNSSRVLEIGSNNGDFLHFLDSRVAETLGVEPAIRISNVANDRGIETINQFFDDALGQKLFKERGNYDLIVARHCFAHNSDLHTMLLGVINLLSDQGTLILENGYIANIFEDGLFDQIYHEHIYYHSVTGLSLLLAPYGLTISDVKPIAIQGGSMVYVIRKRKGNFSISTCVAEYIKKEHQSLGKDVTMHFGKAVSLKLDALSSIIKDLRKEGKVIYAFGASAKASTLINACGLSRYDLSYVVDSTSHKIEKYMPGSGIKVISEEASLKTPPDYFLLTIWNYADEVISKIKNNYSVVPKIIIPHPTVQVLDIL